MAKSQNPFCNAMDRSCDLSLPKMRPCPSDNHRAKVPAEYHREHLIQGFIFGFISDPHAQQLRKFPKPMDIYTVHSVVRDRLQMFDDLVALVYEQTRSSEPVAMFRSLSMKNHAKI